MKPLHILVIDDEYVICKACRMILSEKGHVIELRTNAEAGLNALEKESYDLLLLDMKLPDMDGMEVLKKICKENPRVGIIVMTGYATMRNAVEAMKLGAVDYLSKPFTDDELIAAVENAYAAHRSKASRQVGQAQKTGLSDK